MSKNDLKIARQRREEPTLKEAIKRLEGEDLLDFVLVTTHERGEREAFKIIRSNIRYDTMLGMLCQASYILNAELLNPDVIEDDDSTG